jgi:hypothetical protein
LESGEGRLSFLRGLKGSYTLKLLCSARISTP